VLYGTLLFFPPLPPWLEQSGVAPMVFGPAFYEEKVDKWVALIHSLLDAEFLAELPAKQTRFAEEGIAAAERCLAQCEDALNLAEIDAIGFSISFDSQRLPSATLARKLKQMKPGLKVLAGGTACDEPMGSTMLQHFDCFDAVLSGEAEEVIEASFQSLVDSSFRPPDTQSTRTKDGAINHARSSVLNTAMAALPLPNYDEFYAQWYKSSYGKNKPPLILYEMSRGCWYGYKNHCTFCGIRSVPEPYRTIPAAQAIDEIILLAKKYKPQLIYLTDAIVSREAYKQFFPALAKESTLKKAKVKLFMEAKSNLLPSELSTLALSGVASIQPGIESFITSSLKTMKKGATGIQQINTLKWCAAFGIDVVYGLLLGIQGETQEDRWELSEICELLAHLPPPAAGTDLRLHRFSPNFDFPAKHGIKDVRPFQYQRELYRIDDSSLMNLCYEYDFSGDGFHAFEEPNVARRSKIDPSNVAVQAAVIRWQQRYAENYRLIHFDAGDDVQIIRSDRSGTAIDIYTDASAHILRSSHQPVSLATLQKFADINIKDQLADALKMLQDRGVILAMDNRFLNLAIPISGHKIAGQLSMHERAPIIIERESLHAT